MKKPYLVIGVVIVIAVIWQLAQNKIAEHGQTESSKVVKAKTAKGLLVDVYRDIPYVKGGGKAQQLDIYVPAEAKSSMPLVVAIHGGAWSIGDKIECPIITLLDHGYVVASINYRLIKQGIFPVQIYDCKAAIRYLRAHATEYKIDAKRVGVWGASAGGHLAALLGTSGKSDILEGNLGNNDQSSSVQAVCDWCGVSNFTDLVAQTPPNNKMDFASPTSVMSMLFGQDTRKKTLLAGSPIAYISADDPPFLLVHGDKDDTIPLAQSAEFYRALKQAGVPVEYIVVKGGTHNFASASQFERVQRFFDQYLLPLKK